MVDTNGIRLLCCEIGACMVDTNGIRLLCIEIETCAGEIETCATRLYGFCENQQF